MKKIILSAFAIAMMTGVATSSYAQQGFNVSIKATPQFSFLNNKDDKDESGFEKKATFNTNFGIGAGYNFTSNYGVGLDVLYSLQGQKVETSGVVLNQKMEYVKIPVYFSYQTSAEKPVSFYGKVGPQISLLTSAEIKGDGGSIDVKDAAKPATFGAMANVGVQFRLAEKISLQTGIVFDHDFTNAEDKNYEGFPAGRASTYNMTTGVQVGFKYQL